jgi:putative secretion ATPase (PEP-CTERM system associated)
MVLIKGPARFYKENQAMYESFYNLSAKPFALNPDPRFFFGSRGHKRAQSYLQYGLTQGEGFIVITGDVGTGKTMLVRNLFAGLSKENIVAAQLVTTQLGADDMLRMIAASYGLAHEGLGKATLLKNLETFLITRAREGKRVLLVIDEAQNLPLSSLEELRMLSNFQLAGKVLLQSFLLGQADFKDTLRSPQMEQLRQRVIAAYHLNPLGEDETKTYIEHRLTLVGWTTDPVISDEAHAAIHKYTGGVPRLINQLCDRLLLFGYLEELLAIDLEHVDTVVKELQQETPGSQFGGDVCVEKEEEFIPIEPPSIAKDAAISGRASSNKRMLKKSVRSGAIKSSKKRDNAKMDLVTGDYSDRIALLERRVHLLESKLENYISAVKGACDITLTD